MRRRRAREGERRRERGGCARRSKMRNWAGMQRVKESQPSRFGVCTKII